MTTRKRHIILLACAIVLGAGGALAAPTVVAAVEDGYVSYFFARTLTAFGCF